MIADWLERLTQNQCIGALAYVFFILAQCEKIYRESQARLSYIGN
ncbi:hypothetical protein clem_01195 [Legionella clemsonensis]|uniref:Uncharacterized protein n=1 Tax=Legionella clemsonensis TaxID=1867846 RepID=A0A222NZ34_9GAMM|nr:hypothetical protein clem_01195 [Legionella clemsonensis]